MVTVVIIGILAAIAVPAYKAYIFRSKMAESYLILNAISKSEISFFNEQREFYATEQNPQDISSTMTFESQPTWDGHVYPVPIGQHTNFSYHVVAGATTRTGIEIVTSPNTGATLNIISDPGILGNRIVGGAKCNQATTAADLGIVLENNYNWALLIANADFDNDNTDGLCTSVFQRLHVTAASGGPNSTGYAILNSGHQNC